VTSRITGLRIALAPVVEEDGQTRLGREIAAKVFDLPKDLTHITSVLTQVVGIEDPGAVRVALVGPAFHMVLDPEFHA
jgi:hypothetical protein